MIKKKKFLEKNNVADMTELLGEELDMEAEFDNLDNENREKVWTLYTIKSIPSYAPWIPEFGVSLYTVHCTECQRKRPP